MELEKFESESSLGHFIQKFDNFMKNIRIKLKNNKNIFTKYMKCTKGYARQENDISEKRFEIQH